MGFNFLKKQEVPEELPDIWSAVLEPPLEKQSAQSNSSIVNDANTSPVPLRVSKENIPEQQTPLEKGAPINSDASGFMNQIKENLSKEKDDLEKLEKWYTKQFSSQDILSNMKTYWENHKEGFIIRAVGENFQEKIESEIANLGNLENEWQKIYFQLIEKESQIKEGEKKLKGFMAEFFGECKKFKKIKEQK